MDISDKNYLEKEGVFFKHLNSLMGQYIYLYCNTGSLSRGEVIPGWSDIDVLLVVNEYNKMIFESISNALEKAGNDIKIGVTILSLEEFNHTYFKDSKTYISIRLMGEGYYHPRIIKPEIKFKTQDKTLKKYMDIADFSRFSHDIKREFLKKESYDEKKVYKLIIILLKICLSQRGFVTLGYKETITSAIKDLPNFSVKIPEPEIIIANPESKNERYIIYLQILEWLRKNTNVIFQ